MFVALNSNNLGDLGPARIKLVTALETISEYAGDGPGSLGAIFDLNKYLNPDGSVNVRNVASDLIDSGSTLGTKVQALVIKDGIDFFNTPHLAPGAAAPSLITVKGLTFAQSSPEQQAVWLLSYSSVGPDGILSVMPGSQAVAAGEPPFYPFSPTSTGGGWLPFPGNAGLLNAALGVVTDSPNPTAASPGASQYLYSIDGQGNTLSFSASQSTSSYHLTATLTLQTSSGPVSVTALVSDGPSGPAGSIVALNGRPLTPAAAQELVKNGVTLEEFLPPSLQTPGATVGSALGGSYGVVITPSIDLLGNVHLAVNLPNDPGADSKILDLTPATTAPSEEGGMLHFSSLGSPDDVTQLSDSEFVVNRFQAEGVTSTLARTDHYQVLDDGSSIIKSTVYDKDGNVVETEVAKAGPDGLVTSDVVSKPDGSSLTIISPSDGSLSTNVSTIKITGSDGQSFTTTINGGTDVGSYIGSAGVIGSFIGNELAQLIAAKNPLVKLLTSTALSTAGNLLSQEIASQILKGTDLSNLAIGNQFATSFAGAAGGYAGGQAGAALFKSIGVDPVIGSIIGSTLGSAVAIYAVEQGISAAVNTSTTVVYTAQSFGDTLGAAAPDAALSLFEEVTGLNPTVDAFGGSEEDTQIGASIGGTIGSVLDTYFGVPIVFKVVGQFVGSIIGSLFGEPTVGPNASDSFGLVSNGQGGLVFAVTDRGSDNKAPTSLVALIDQFGNNAVALLNGELKALGVTVISISAAERASLFKGQFWNSTSAASTIDFPNSTARSFSTDYSRALSDTVIRQLQLSTFSGQNPALVSAMQRSFALYNPNFLADAETNRPSNESLTQLNYDIQAVYDYHQFQINKVAFLIGYAVSDSNAVADWKAEYARALLLQDVFSFHRGQGSVVGSTYSATNTGNEGVLTFDCSVPLSDVSVQRVGNDMVFTVVSSGETFTLQDALLDASHGIGEVRFLASDLSVTASWTGAELVAALKAEPAGTGAIPIVTAPGAGNPFAAQFGGPAHDTLVAGGPPIGPYFYPASTRTLFDGKGGHDTEYGSSGADIFAYNRGYGHLQINDQAGYNVPATATLQLGAGIKPSDLAVTCDGEGNVTLRDGTAGDEIVIHSMAAPDPYGYYNYGIGQIAFTDGTVLTRQQILAQAGGLPLPSPDGTPGADVFAFSASTVSTGGADGSSKETLPSARGIIFANGEGGADTFIYNFGASAVEIADGAYGGTEATLRFGTFIFAGDVSVAGDENGNVFLTDSLAGMSVQLDHELGGEGVSQVVFADGTTWTQRDLFDRATTGTLGNDALYGSLRGSDTFDGKGGNDYEQGAGDANTYVFNRGYGHLEINQDTGGGTGGVRGVTLLLDPGITADSLDVTGDKYGNMFLADGTPGDRIEIDGEVSRYIDNGYSGPFLIGGVNQAKLADGTVLTATQLVAMTTIGTPGADDLYGPRRAAALFDGKGAPAGSQDYEQGWTGADTFAYGAGYGRLEINEDAGYGDSRATLQLGAGITAAALSVAQDQAGDLLLTDGVAGDQVTIDKELAAGYGGYAQYGIGQVTFDDGTVLTRQQLVALLPQPTSVPVIANTGPGTDVPTFVADSGTAPAQPFGTVAVTDPGGGRAEYATVMLTNSYGYATDADGTLTGSGLTRTGVGTYALVAASPAALTTALQNLAFTPTNHQVAPGQSVQTGFAFTVTNSQFGSATYTALPVVAMAVNTPPTISGVFAGQVARDGAAIQPFLTVGVTDPDLDALESATITVANAQGKATDANGTLSGSGLTQTGPGIYTLAAAAPDALMAELDAVKFTPTLHEVAIGQTVTSGFTLSIMDDQGATVTNAATTVTVAAVNTSPVILNTLLGQAANAGSPVAPFAQAFISEPIESATDTAVLILTDAQGRATDANGTLSGTGLTQTGVGTYALVPATSDVLSAELEAIQFTPAAPSATSSQAVTTGITLTVADNQGGTATDAGTSVVATGSVAVAGTAEANPDQLVQGTAGDDYLSATAAASTIDGHGGHDTEQGRGGGDTFVFNPGYGQLEIREFDFGSDAHNRLLLGPGITPSDVTVAATASHDMVLGIGTNGDQVTLKDVFHGPPFGVQQVRFADGTTWDQATLIAKQMTGGPGSDYIYGTSGADLIDGKGGGDTVQGLGGADTFVFNKGYGALEVDENNHAEVPSVLRLGQGIVPSDVTVGIVSDDYTDSFLLRIGTGGDQVTLYDMAVSKYWGVNEVQFADGTAWTRSQVAAHVSTGALATHTITGTPGTEYLAGTPGNDLLDGRGGGDTVAGGGGNDTYVMRQGYGSLTVDKLDGRRRGGPGRGGLRAGHHRAEPVVQPVGRRPGGERAGLGRRRGRQQLVQRRPERAACRVQGVQRPQARRPGGAARDGNGVVCGQHPGLRSRHGDRDAG